MRWQRTAACLLLWLNLIGTGVAQDDASALQQGAADRVEAFRQNFLKTGDRTRLLPDLERAAGDLTRSVEMFTRANQAAGAARSLIKLGELRRLQGRHAEAMDACARGLALAEKAGDTTGQALALIGLGRAESEGPKDLASAAAHFQRAVTIGAELPDRTHLFNALSYVAQTQLFARDLIGASDTLNRALSLAPEIKDPSLVLFVYIDRGDIYQKLADKCEVAKLVDPGLQNLKLARQDFDAAMALARKYGYNGLVPLIQQMLQTVAIRRQTIQGNARLDAVLAKTPIFAPKKPSDVLVDENFRSPEIPEIAGVFEAVQQTGVFAAGDATSLVARGHFHLAQGENDQALAAYLKAADLLEVDRRALRDEKSRGKFFEDKINLYYPAISELLQRRRFADAFEIMERSRARVMAELLSSRKIALAKPEEQALFGETQRLRAEIALLQTKVFEWRSRQDRERHANEIETTSRQIAKLEEQERAITAQMAAKAPRLNEMVVTRPAPLARVQEMLRRDQCDLLYYLVFNERVIVWHIGPEVVRAKSVFLTQNELKKKIAALREGLKSRDAATNTTAARELFLFLVQPVVDGIKQRHVILIPHAELHYLPFAALIDPQGRAMGERFALSDAPSAGILLDLSKGSVPENSRVLAAADPEIEEARSEVTAIAELYAGRGKSVIDPLITESEVKASAANYEVLHLSVHGKFSPMEPMLSYLQLGNDGRDDGRLTAAEMFGLPLGKAKLVVLSACETGQATATPGNEILGIERALLYAGANNLVLSGWPVDAASTALWMKIFHRAARNEPLAEAARLALLEVKQKFPHPYHWAAFRLVGK